MLVDPLSTMMMLIVTGVGGLIVLYSIGYMDGDDEERRFFAYMSLFVFSMLLLVEGGNLLMLLVGWGLVGLSSYLLIGFWHEKPSAVAAAKKAFVMNAFGDATMALAFFVLIAHSNSLDFATSFTTASHLSQTTVDLVALGLLGGAAAKSAQIPLHTWLPDAMEGPTPVSALIHAATMVTAGVYLIARTHPIFEQARTIELIGAGLGALTLIVAGLVALVQTDIKRVIAYSTMSQIGYMFMAVGVGGYANGMFHLMTHAFFKATLFMGAGLVIHALAGEQDIRKMGGIAKVMPWTRWMFLAASLALAGIFPFAGFFSKDPIIASTLNIGWYGYVFWACGIIGAFLTGLYTFRLYFIVFPGKPSTFVEEHHHDHHGHEGPWTMLIPVAVLTVLSIFGGWIQFEPPWHLVTDWLEPVAAHASDRGADEHAGVAHERDRSRRRALRHRRRVCDLRHRAARRPATARRAARARAQALLRRGVRRNLLQAGRRLLDVPAEKLWRIRSSSPQRLTWASRRWTSPASCGGSRRGCCARTSCSSAWGWP